MPALCERVSEYVTAVSDTYLSQPKLVVKPLVLTLLTEEYCILQEK